MSSFCQCSGYKNYPHRRGRGVKNWQNSVQVVFECPCNKQNFTVIIFNVYLRVSMCVFELDQVK